MFLYKLVIFSLYYLLTAGLHSVHPFGISGMVPISASCSRLLPSDNAPSVIKYNCERCGKEFFWNQSYRRHLNYCQTVTMVPCEICNKVYTRIDNMRAHMKSVHGIASLQKK